MINQKYPKLKPGVGIAITDDNRSLIGFPHRGVSQPLPKDTSFEDLLYFLQTLTGEEIAIPKAYEKLIESLSNHKLLTWVEKKGNDNKLKLDVSTMLRNEALQPELKLFSWGTVEENEEDINNRNKYAISIYGDNRLAISLLYLLHNTGYTNTTFYQIDNRKRTLTTTI